MAVTKEEPVMAQIRTKKDSAQPVRLRDRIVSAIKWWGEHQAWPATEDVRIEWRRSSCR